AVRARDAVRARARTRQTSRQLVDDRVLEVGMIDRNRSIDETDPDIGRTAGPLHQRDEPNKLERTHRRVTHGRSGISTPNLVNNARSEDDSIHDQHSTSNPSAATNRMPGALDVRSERAGGSGSVRQV